MAPAIALEAGWKGSFGRAFIGNTAMRHTGAHPLDAVVLMHLCVSYHRTICTFIEAPGTRQLRVTERRATECLSISWRACVSGDTVCPVRSNGRRTAQSPALPDHLLGLLMAHHLL